MTKSTPPILKQVSHFGVYRTYFVDPINQDLYEIATNHKTLTNAFLNLLERLGVTLE